MFYESLAMLEGKIKVNPFFLKVQSGKITVCNADTHTFFEGKNERCKND